MNGFTPHSGILTSSRPPKCNDEFSKSSGSNRFVQSGLSADASMPLRENPNPVYGPKGLVEKREENELLRDEQWWK